MSLFKAFPLAAVGLLMSATLGAQTTGIVTGTIVDEDTREPLIGVTVTTQDVSVGTVTGIDGTYRLELPTGSVSLRASYVGYAIDTRENLLITSGNIAQVNFELRSSSVGLEEVIVRASDQVTAAAADRVTPLSIQKLTADEIRSNPGGNFDISRVVQVLPGVGGSQGSGGGPRNDLIIRGGGPGENVFYLDGIEIPTINHFSTQGASGGPQGILNVSFIENVTLASSAFDARYDNALASVFSFDQKDGNPERLQGNFRLSATEVALTTDGPIGKKSSFIASVRRSYLQLLFEAIGLPIRPNYWDFQGKFTTKLSDKTTLSILGVGALDEFSFVAPDDATPEDIYTLSSNPSINQDSYTVGASLRQRVNSGYWTLALSRNSFQNRLDRFEDNVNPREDERLFGSVSDEIENKLRWTMDKSVAGWKYAYGGVLQNVGYTNDFTSVVSREVLDSTGAVVSPAVAINFNTDLNFWRYGMFGSVARSFLDDRFGVSFGVRVDGNSFSESGNELYRTLSPRLSLNYRFNDKWKASASVGNYYRIAPYTVLGFRQNGEFANQDVEYIRSTHFVVGGEWLPRADWRITMEGFYKDYGNYPVSLLTGQSLANQGGSFGAIGNEAVQSSGDGEVYGLEAYAQKKLTTNIFGVLSYTYVRSRFAGLDGELIPAAWDSRHLISALLGRKFKRNWELGLKYRFAGGAPFTPFDLEASQRNYLTTGRGTLDFNRTNSVRLGNFNRLDVRIDKKWNFQRWSLDIFLDVENAFVLDSPALPEYTFARTADNSDFQTTDGNPIRADGANAIPLILDNNDPFVQPSVGVIVEF